MGWSEQREHSKLQEWTQLKGRKTKSKKEQPNQMKETIDAKEDKEMTLKERKKIETKKETN